MAMIKAVGFDVGHTLDGFCSINVLMKYNTRVNYREWETTSDCISGQKQEY